MPFLMDSNVELKSNAKCLLVNLFYGNYSTAFGKPLFVNKTVQLLITLTVKNGCEN